MFAPLLKNQKKSSQTTLEGLDCFSSSFARRPAGKALRHDFIVFFDINISRALSLFNGCQSNATLSKQPFCAKNFASWRFPQHRAGARSAYGLMALSDAGSSCIFFFLFFIFFLFGIMQEAAASKRMNAMAHIKFNRRLVLLRRLEGERSRPSKAAARAFLWALRRPVKETPKGQGVDASSLLF